MRGVGFQLAGQTVEHLLIDGLHLGIVDGAGGPDIFPQCLADIDEPHEFKALVPGGQFLIDGVEDV